MLPVTENLLREIEQAKALIEGNDQFGPFERQIMRQLIEYEKVEKAIHSWLPRLTAQVEALAREVSERDAQIAALQAPAVDAPVVDDITVRKRPPLRDVNGEAG